MALPMRPSRLPALALLILAAAVSSAWAPAGQAQQKEVRVYNWTDYTVESELKRFEIDTGIRVDHRTYDSNEILDAKLRMGGWGYDVVVPTASPFFAGQLKAGFYQKLDRSKLPGWSNVDPAILALLATYDPGNQYGVPLMWGTIGIGYNVDEVKKRMPDAPVDSLAMIFDTAVLAKFKDCGVVMLDSSTEILPAALKYLGLDPDSKKPDDLRRAGALLRAVRPFVRRFDSIDYINALGDGEICLAFGFAGGIFQARDRGLAATPRREIGYAAPKEGSQLWIDVAAIPKDAPNVDNAHRFIDFLLDPAIAAYTTEATGYASANRAAKRLISRDLASSPMIYPPDAVRARFYSVTPGSPEDARERTRQWARIARGR
jgi:putrescine transport system substrate-binding protein